MRYGSLNLIPMLSEAFVKTRIQGEINFTSTFMPTLKINVSSISASRPRWTKRANDLRSKEKWIGKKRTEEENQNQNENAFLILSLQNCDRTFLLGNESLVSKSIDLRHNLLCGISNLSCRKLKECSETISIALVVLCWNKNKTNSPIKVLKGIERGFLCRATTLPRQSCREALRVAPN